VEIRDFFRSKTQAAIDENITIKTTLIVVMTTELKNAVPNCILSIA
jgi:hypothetical protein